MTRETKIGLLVGLAFIIVIGILLSDHLTTRGELPQAQLTQVGNNVRTASAVPAGNSAPFAPVAVPQNVTPTAPVLTSGEINSRPSTAIVQITPPHNPTNAVVDTGNNPAASTASSSTDASVTTTPTRGDRIGTPLAAIDTNPLANDKIFQPVNPGQTPQSALAVANNLKPHKAEKGDTVSRLAAKFLGANTTANRQLIIDANPSLKADPAKIVIGRTYMIPSKPETASAAPKSPDQLALAENTVQMVDLARPATTDTRTTDTKTTETKSPKSTVTTTTYTVKDKDTLWKIANGDTALLKEIQDLNKDTLKGKTTVHPGSTLKIPTKTTVASR